MGKKVFMREIENETGEKVKALHYEGHAYGQCVFRAIFEDGSSTLWNCWMGTDYDGKPIAEVYEI